MSTKRAPERRFDAGEAAGPAAVLILGLGAAWLFPDDLLLLTRIAAMALLVVSLDLVVGYCGVATLGHAALFGAGAYAAGIAAVSGCTDPLAMLAVGAASGALAGLLAGAVILSTGGLPQLVLSIATVQLMHEAANKASGVTGGSDGLSGIAPTPLFGLFAFDLFGRTAYALALGVLVLVLALLGRVTRSPFGLLCRAIRDDAGRVSAMGGRPYPRLVAMYALAGAVAGVGGALSAVSTGVVGLDSVSFERSAEALVMLVLGGAGTLYGAVIGTAVFMVFAHIVAASSPFHWLTMVGALLIAVVLFLPHGLGQIGAGLRTRLLRPGAQRQ